MKSRFAKPYLRWKGRLYVRLLMLIGAFSLPWISACSGPGAESRRYYPAEPDTLMTAEPATDSLSGDSVEVIPPDTRNKQTKKAKKDSVPPAQKFVPYEPAVDYGVPVNYPTLDPKN